MKKNKKILSILFAISMFTSTASAVDFSQTNAVWNGVGGMPLIADIFRTSPNAMTIDTLKQLRYRNFADGEIATLTPYGNNILYLDFKMPDGTNKRLDEDRAPSSYLPDTKWVFDDFRQELALSRVNLDDKYATYADVENIKTLMGDTLTTVYNPYLQKYLPASTENYTGSIVNFYYDQFGRLEEIKTSNGTTQHIYETESFEITPQHGDGSIENQYIGTTFTFKAVTALCVNEISIKADNNKTNPNEIGSETYELTYDILKNMYGMTCTPNGDGQTKTWRVSLPLYLYGEREFRIITDGRDFNLKINATVDKPNVTGSFSPTPQQGNDIKVKVNGNYVNFDVLPQIINDRTMIPLRAVAEAFGAEVIWEGDRQEIAIKGKVSDNMNIWMNLRIGSDRLAYMQFNSDYSYAISDGYSFQLDSPPIIVNDRTLLPIRAIAELMGYTVEWDSANKTVIIYK